jgi:hypothetical protein
MTSQLDADLVQGGNIILSPAGCLPWEPGNRYNFAEWRAWGNDFRDQRLKDRNELRGHIEVQSIILPTHQASSSTDFLSQTESRSIIESNRLSQGFSASIERDLIVHLEAKGDSRSDMNPDSDLTLIVVAD